MPASVLTLVAWLAVSGEATEPSKRLVGPLESVGLCLASRTYVFYGGERSGMSRGRGRCVAETHEASVRR